MWDNMQIHVKDSLHAWGFAACAECLDFFHGAQEVTILSIRCRVKPASPADVGATDWEHVKKSMLEQAAKPLKDRIRPCHRQRPYGHSWWWIEQVPWCLRCEDSEWHLEADGTKVITFFHSRKKDVVDLIVPETGEIFQYEIGKGFINENPAG